jgi:hypothetical protein
LIESDADVPEITWVEGRVEVQQHEAISFLLNRAQLTLRLQDGRTLPFAFSSSDGTIVERGSLRWRQRPEAASMTAPGTQPLSMKIPQRDVATIEPRRSCVERWLYWKDGTVETTQEPIEADGTMFVRAKDRRQRHFEVTDALDGDGYIIALEVPEQA